MQRGTDDDGKDRAFPTAPEQNELCSPELRTFLRTHHQIYDFFLFNIMIATRVDDQRMTAAKALAKLGRPKDVEALKLAEEEPEPAFKKLQEFGRLQQENICIRSVNNFMSYLSEIVQASLMKKPEILRSSESVKLEDILRFSNYKELVAFLVNRKVNELSYKSLSDFEDFIRDRTGLSLSESEDHKNNIMFGIEVRNAFTHSRGIVTDTTIRRLSKIDHGRSISVGRRFEAGFDELVSISNSLVAVARDLDQRFCEKFKIRRKRYKSY